MVTYTFPFYFSCGPDEEEGDIDVTLSDARAGKLERSAGKGGRLSLKEDEALDDIFDIIRDRLIEEFSFDLTKEERQTFTDTVSMNILYPRELQGWMGERDEGKEKRDEEALTVFL